VDTDHRVLTMAVGQ